MSPLEWWNRKLQHLWILPSIIKSCFCIHPHHWDAVPLTMNGGESQHHWTNTQTDTQLTLLEAIVLSVIPPYLTCNHSLYFSIECVKLIKKTANELCDSSQR